MSQVFHGTRIVTATIPLAALAPDAQAAIAGGMTAVQVDAKINEFKAFLFGGDVPAAMDTFIELAAAITQDRTGFAALQAVVAGKATQEQLTVAVANVQALLLGTATSEGNTLGKVEALAKAARDAAINAIADGSVTNAKLAADNKVGSLNAAANAYPTAVQSGLTSVEKFLVYLAQQLSTIQASAGQQQGSTSNHEGRITALETTLSTKASTTELNALALRVGQAETSLATKASSTELNTLAQRVASTEAVNNDQGTRIATLEGKVGSGASTGGASTGGTGAFSGTFTGTFNGITLRNAGNGDKYLADDGSYKTLVIPASLPSQAGMAGRALKTDGANAYWADLGSLAVYWESAARSTTNAQTILEYINSLGGTSLELQFEVGAVAGESTLSSRRVGRFKSADVVNMTYFRITLIGATGNTEVYAGDPRTGFDFTLVANNRYRWEVTVADGSKGSSIILYP